ncbi:MAG: S-layer homology domain-containing protein [Oscillospiraceae bacterium]|nr:S-layer homology domain-containing protein [Oscillospiraceae bacterium]
MKRTVCWLLIMAALCGLFALPAAADETPRLTASEAGITFIKNQEGFSARRVWDYTQYSIGYGTVCSAGAYPNGISREEADKLLRAELYKMDDKLNAFMTKHNIALSQAQYDALISFTYNLGVAWLSGCRLTSLLTAGQFTEAEFASALGVWCHAGTKIHYGVLERRIREAQMFLYGDYTGKESKQFRYLLLSGNGGTVDADIYLYPAGAPYGTLPSATRQNRSFAGWMTTGGTLLTEETVVAENLSVSARWATANPASKAFSDVKEGAWYYTGVDELYNDKVISGYADGTFRPNGTVTVGEALKMILRACGDPEQSASGAHWATGYRDLAVKKGLVTAAELPDLDARISRYMIAKLAAKRLGLTATSPNGTFADAKDDYSLALHKAGIVQGTKGADGRQYFFPDQPISRAEISAIVYRIKNR